MSKGGAYTQPGATVVRDRPISRRPQTIPDADRLDPSKRLGFERNRSTSSDGENRSVAREEDMGVTRFDIVQANQFIGAQAPQSPWGRAWYVDGNQGGGSGKSPESAFLTMEEAFAVIRSGDAIYLRGNIREQLSTPAGVFDVHIIGPSPVTRHPDSHSDLGGFSSARWNAPASPTASTPLLKIQQQGWRITNTLFTGDEDDSVGCVQLFRDGGSGDDERDASHSQITGCRFQGGLYGIQDSGGCARISIDDNEFMLFSESDNDAIINVTGAGIGTLWGWRIRGNDFHANHTDIDAALSGARITDNHFHHVSLGVTNTIAIDETGGAENLVARNFFYCASDEASVVNARFVKAASSIWGPNYYSDKEEYGEPAE